MDEARALIVGEIGQQRLRARERATVEADEDFRLFCLGRGGDVLGIGEVEPYGLLHQDRPGMCQRLLHHRIDRSLVDGEHGEISLGGRIEVVDAGGDVRDRKLLHQRLGLVAGPVPDAGDRHAGHVLEGANVLARHAAATDHGDAQRFLNRSSHEFSPSSDDAPRGCAAADSQARPSSSSIWWKQVSTAPGEALRTSMPSRLHSDATTGQWPV